MVTRREGSPPAICQPEMFSSLSTVLYSSSHCAWLGAEPPSQFTAIGFVSSSLITMPPPDGCGVDVGLGVEATGVAVAAGAVAVGGDGVSVCCGAAVGGGGAVGAVVGA